MLGRSGSQLLSACSGGLFLGCAAQDAKHFLFAHDDEVFAIDFDLGAGVLAEQNAVTLLHIEGANLTFFANFAFAYCDDFALLGLVFSGVWNDDPTASGFCFLHATDQNAIMQGGKLSHSRSDSFQYLVNGLNCQESKDRRRLLALNSSEC